jgi:hypothetical protein
LLFSFLSFAILFLKINYLYKINGVLSGFHK